MSLGLYLRCASVSKMAGMAAQDTLLKLIFRGKNLTQYTLSRFLTSSNNWTLFGQKRIQRLQQDPDTQLQDGDVVALDDTLVIHPYGKRLPFLSWHFDHSLKINVWGMNLVALHSVLRNGLEYPLFYRFWRKPEANGEGLTKFDLACEMLTQLRESVQCRLWVAMDRWYLKKEFF